MAAPQICLFFRASDLCSTAHPTEQLVGTGVCVCVRAQRRNPPPDKKPAVWVVGHRFPVT